MSQILYYFLLKPLSLLPLAVLYRFSDVLYLAMRVGFAYRKKVVEENLLIAFPEKNVSERNEIMWKFYRHLCDLMIESIKLFSISKKEAIKRFKLINPEVFESIYQQERSALLVGGHYNNWELYAVASAPQIPYKLLGIYTPMSNSFFNKKFAQSRSRYGLILVPKKQVKSTFETYKDDLTVTTFAIDQCPRKGQKIQWVDFLNVKTAAHFGAEKYAREYNYAVVYGRAKKVKRGYYELHFELMEADPREAPLGAITQQQTNLLEKQINEAPEFWLWTHKRWKLKP